MDNDCNHEFAIGKGNLCVKCHRMYEFMFGEYLELLSIDQVLK